MYVGGFRKRLNLHLFPFQTRMHSSRDAYRPLVDRMLESASRGGGLLRGGVWSGGCLLGGRVSALGGGSAWGGCLLWGGSGLGGGCLLRGGCVVASQHALRQIPPPCEQNDRQV